MVDNKLTTFVAVLFLFGFILFGYTISHHNPIDDFNPISNDKLMTVWMIHSAVPALREEISQELNSHNGYINYEYDELLKKLDAHIRLNGQRSILIEDGNDTRSGYPL